MILFQPGEAALQSVQIQKGVAAGPGDHGGVELEVEGKQPIVTDDTVVIVQLDRAGEAIAENLQLHSIQA